MAFLSFQGFFRHATLLVGMGMLMTVLLHADIQSTSGNIAFDVQSNGNAELTLSTSGLGVGVAPSANLDVSGNAAFSENLGVATSSTNSSLEVSGSFGMNVQLVTSHANVTGNSIILADTSSDNITLEMPNASDVEGRVYNIKKLSNSNQLLIMNGPFDNLTELALTDTAPTLAQTSLVSSSGNWYILNLSGNGDLLSSANLIGWWKLDGTSGNTASDSSIYSKTGNLSDGFTFDASSSDNAIVGKALVFDGTDDYISIPITESLGAHTLSAWVYYDITTQFRHDKIISLYGNSDDDEYWVGLDGLNPSTITYKAYKETPFETDLVKADASYTGKKWTHVAVTLDDAGLMTMYIDGVAQADTETFGKTIAVDNSMIGSQADNPVSTHCIQGSIDDVRVYSRTLSASEISTLYQFGL